MKIKLLFSILLSALVSLTHAGIPEGYYTNIDGQKYTTLKSALSSIISDHTVLGYSSLWNYYPSTYYHLDNRTQVLDMYSSIVRFYNGTSVVDGMNKEHTVPKSWWGGSTAAAPGNDLYNVIPSDATANSRKSNYSLGVVSNATYTNEITTIGTGNVNGTKATFFEPADCYKGDFARIYFYMATCYPSLNWDNNNAEAMTNNSLLTLKSWIIPLLVQWSKEDPVDEEEIQRNEDIFTFQGNRNPFIDYPSLVDYIWGEKSEESFYLSEHKANEGGSSTMYAGIPRFSLIGGTEENPKCVNAGTKVTVKGSSNLTTLYTRYNNGDWTETQPTIAYFTDEPTQISPEISYVINESCNIEAFCTQEGRVNSDTLIRFYKVVDYSQDYLLYEDFNSVTAGNNTTSTGSASAWDGNDNFPLVTTVYKAGNAVKLGSGKNTGSLVSKPLDFVGGTLYVQIGVKGWTTIEGSLNVMLTGSTQQTVSYTSAMADDFQILTLKFDNVSENPELTISTTAKRAFINLVSVSANASTSIDSPLIFTPSHDVYYNISGQKISGKPSRPGIYLFNGRKVMIRK